MDSLEVPPCFEPITKLTKKPRIFSKNFISSYLPSVGFVPVMEVNLPKKNKQLSNIFKTK